MDAITLLVLGAAICALGVIFFTVVGIKFRNEEWVFFVVIAVVACAGGAAWCLQEAVKRADNRPAVTRPQ